MTTADNLHEYTNTELAALIPGSGEVAALAQLIAYKRLAAHYGGHRLAEMQGAALQAAAGDRAGYERWLVTQLKATPSW